MVLDVEGSPFPQDVPERKINREEAPTGADTSDEDEDPDLEVLGQKEQRNPGRRGRARKRAAASAKSGKRINCGICGKSQAHGRRLKEHMRNVHRGPRSPCERCRQVCSTPHNKNRHDKACRASQHGSPQGELQEEDPTWKEASEDTSDKEEDPEGRVWDARSGGTPGGGEERGSEQLHATSPRRTQIASGST